VIDPDRSATLLAALARLGRWSRAHSRSPLLLPPSSPPPKHIRLIRAAVRLARIPAMQLAAILAGAACYSRALLDETLDGEDWTARVVAADLEQSGGGQ